ncbi:MULTISPECIES: cation:proton antiporter [unclassified Lebetimonas]|uniref:cation:proton antiporter n=1 Tax=unclassified Lebetimonas TaxID=2648158 RepID=UPI000466FE87|nr:MULTISPECIES: cation:proton antiporter [unclassified Lebetimonas]
MKLEIESLVVVALIIIAGIIALEISFSPAIFEIIAGSIAANFFHMSDLKWAEFLANVGLLGLMFFAGLESDLKLLKKNFIKAVFIGVSSFLLPFVSIFLISKFILLYSLKASLLISIALSTTSLALVYPLLKDKNMLHLNSGQTLLAGAMIVDIISMFSLSFLFEGINYQNIIFLGVLLIVMFVLPKFGEKLFARYTGNHIEFPIRFIIAILISIGFLSKEIHINEAVLAFALGIFFSEFLKEHEMIEKKLRAIIFGFVAPFFFFKAGYSIKLDVINFKILFLSIILGIIAFGTKYLATVIATKPFFKKSVYKIAGLFFNMRLTFGIVASVFGLEFKIIDVNTYVSLLLIIISTSLAASVLMKRMPSEITEEELEDFIL